MTVKKIKKDICWVGAIDWDRRLFDELIPLPEGTSYNAYLIKGQEKTALIDTVDPTKEDDLLDNLDDLEIEYLDYIVVNHAEQDHSGAIPLMLELYSEAKIVTNQKCKKMLMEHLLVKEEKIITVNDNDVLSLGGKTLHFLRLPEAPALSFLKQLLLSVLACLSLWSYISSPNFLNINILISFTEN